MWHKDRSGIKSLFVLLYWPLSMRPRQHDRFVLIGLCWLYGRSEFPPPPPHDDQKIAKRSFVDNVGLSGQPCRTPMYCIASTAGWPAVPSIFIANVPVYYVA